MTLLEPVENSVWTERLSGVLGTLATIYRQRGDLVECYNLVRPASSGVQGWYDRMLTMYARHVQLREEQGWKTTESMYAPISERKCLKGLRYKYHRIVVNLSVDLLALAAKRAGSRPPPKLSKAYVGASLRVIIQDEIDRKVVDDDFRWMLSTFLNKPETQRGLDSTSDELLGGTSDIIASKTAQMQSAGTLPSVAPGQPNVFTDNAVLKTCSTCGKREQFLGTLLRCGACFSVHYCNAVCQKSHWKRHKPDCKRLKKEKDARDAEENENAFSGLSVDEVARNTAQTSGTASLETVLNFISGKDKEFKGN